MKKGLLFLMLALAGLFGGSFDVFAAEKTTSPFAGITIEQAAGRTDLYLYNVESGYWLQENNRQRGSWNTRGNLDAHGFDVAITAISGGYQINPKFGHNNSMNSSNWYLDTGDAVTAWTFNSITKEGVNNAYQIKSGDNWLHATPENDGFMLICNNVEARATWQIVTREERINYLTSNATEDNPVDATFLVKRFNLANEDTRGSAWVQAMDGGNSDWNRADDGDNGYRCLQAHGFWNSKTSSYTQTIADVPDGIYEFYCTGFYRDGNRDQCQERRSAGTETIRGFMFINNERAPLKSILDGAQQSSGNGFGYHNGSYSYGYFPDGGDDVTRAFVSTPDAYLNDPVRATVAGGTMNVGIDKTEYTGGGDWVFFSRFRLRYLGPAGLSGYLDALNSAISSAEAFSGETSDVLASNLTSALSAARALVDSRDTDAISAATGALNEALNAAHAVDVSVLKATKTLAEAEGVSIPASVTSCLANGTTIDEVNNSLFDLRAARKIKALRMPDIYTGSAPAAGKVYLFNLGTGQFLGSGSDWNTHAAVDQAGIEITLIADGDNFKMQTNYGWLNYGAYVDTGGQDVWHFVPVAGKSNVYNISSTGNDGNLLGYDPNGPTDGKKYWSTIAKDRTDFDNLNNQWKIITPAERATLIAKASPSNPVDVSYLITNPSLNRKDGYDMWTKSGGARVNTQDDNDGNRCESYGWEFYDTGNASFTQTIADIEPGIYVVSVNAFYRDGDGNYQAGVYNDGGELLQEASLIANSESTLLPNVASVIGKMPGIATKETKDGTFVNWPKECLEAFETGFYKTSVQVTVGSDRQLTLGISQTAKSHGGCWIVLDNFRLTYLGPTSESVTVTSAGYATYCSNHALDFTGKDIKAYVGTKTGDKLTFTPATQVPAGTGLLLVYNGGKTEDVPVIASATAVENNCLVGVNEQTTINSNDYILNVVNGGAGFYKAGSFTTLGAHKAYIPAAVGGSVKGFTIDFEDDATGISLMEDGRSQMEDGVIYNLAGQRLSKTQKGINIVNGKKIAVK